MKNILKKTVFTLLLLVLALICIPNSIKAAEKEVQFKDKKMYEAVKDSLSRSKIAYQSNDDNHTIVVDIDNVSRLELTLGSITDISGIEEFTDLKYLTFGYSKENSISDISPLENLTNLEMLLISNNNISDISPLENLTNLEALVIENNNISDISPLENLTNLSNIYLSDNPIDGDISILKNLKKLCALTLDNCNVSDITPLQDANLYNLRLNGNHISDVSALGNWNLHLVYGYYINNQTVEKNIVENEKIEEELPQLFRKVLENGGREYYSDDPNVSFSITVEGNASAYIEGENVIIENAKAGDKVSVKVLGGRAVNSIITYNIVEETQDITGRVIFEDDDNIYDKRPDEVTINLIENGEVVATTLSTADEGWEYTFENVPVRDYTVSVEEVENYVASYEDYDIILTCTYEEIESPETSDINIIAISAMFIVSISGIMFVLKNKEYNS